MGYLDVATYSNKTPEEQQRLEKEHVAEVLGTLRRSKSIAKKRAAEMAKKLEVRIIIVYESCGSQPMVLFYC